MNRLRGRLLNSLTAFSLLAFIFAVTLWIRSCHVVDQIDWRHQSRYFNLLSDVGALHLTFIHEQKYFTIAADAKRDWQPKPEDLTGWHVRDWAESIVWQPHAPLWQRTGLVGASIQYQRNYSFFFVVEGGRYMLVGNAWEIQLPYWLLSLMALYLPSFRLIFLLRRRYRRKIGACAKCGYDLRATPDRCPECGAVAGPISQA